MTAENTADVPVYRWRLAPLGLATRRQLAARGLSPRGGVVAELRGRSRRRGVLVAYLYDESTAVPKRPVTPAMAAALGRALAARRRCPECHQDRGYTIPARYGCCVPCAQNAGWI